MSLRRNILLLKIFEALRASLFILPIITIYYNLQKNVGIDGFYITESAFSLAIFMMIVPVGFLSDLWKRKNVLVIGAFLAALGFLVELLGYGLRDMFVGEFLVGVGFACCSSTVTALAHDTLADMKREDLQAELQGQLSIYTFISTAFASVIGSWLYKIHPDIPMLLTVMMCLLAMICALFMIEPNRVKENVNIHPLRDMYETVKYALHGHKEVACIILMMVVLFTITKLLFWVHQPYFELVNIPIEHFGWLVALGLVFGSFGAWLSYKLEPKLKPWQTVSFILIFPVLSYGIAGFWVNQESVVFLVLVSTVFGFAKPVIDHAINKRVSSARRSTVHGAKSLFHNLAFILSAYFVGVYAESFGPASTMMFLAGILFVFSIPVLVLLRIYKIL
jgi:MFS family permease